MGDITVEFLGTRGSVSVEGLDYREYGGATACVVVHMGNQMIVLDAGSGFHGMEGYFPENQKEFALLFSHTHIDHLGGLLCEPIMFDSSYEVHIYGITRRSLTIQEQIDCLLQPPIWPIGQSSFTIKRTYHNVEDTFYIGDVLVKTAQANHPGGSTVYRLEYQGRSVVYMTDHEFSEETREAMEEIAQHATLLICDGQYTPAEYKVRNDFGHSNYEDTIAFARKVGCEQLAIFHHDPMHHDTKLNEMEHKVQEQMTNALLARKGGVIRL